MIGDNLPSTRSISLFGMTACLNYRFTQIWGIGSNWDAEKRLLSSSGGAWKVVDWQSIDLRHFHTESPKRESAVIIRQIHPGNATGATSGRTNWVCEFLPATSGTQCMCWDMWGCLHSWAPQMWDRSLFRRLPWETGRPSQLHSKIRSAKHLQFFLRYRTHPCIGTIPSKQAAKAYKINFNC